MIRGKEKTLCCISSGVWWFRLSAETGAQNTETLTKSIFSEESNMNFRSRSGRAAALFLALTAAVLMAVPAFATYGWCMHTYGFTTTYTPETDADGAVTGRHFARTACSFCGAVNVHLACARTKLGRMMSG